MTANHPLRRFLARVCSPETMAGVVDPTLADIRWESGRPLWRGCLSLAKALLIHAIASTPGAVSNAWSDDERAIPKAAAFVTAAALFAAVPLMAPPLLSAFSSRQAFSFAVAVLLPSLVPQAVALTLPAALLLAFPVAFRRQPPSARLARRAVALSIGVVAVTFVVLAWLIPDANQAFRVRVARILGASRNLRIERGPMELTFTELRERIDVLQLAPDGGVAARRLEYTYQMRLALAITPLPVGLLALGISASPRTRWRSWLTGAGAMALYFCGLFPMFMAAEWSMVRATNLPPFVFAWAPNLLLFAGAAIIRRRPHSLNLPSRPPASLAV